nr:IS1595 family transposase [Candidatus Liberibacter solanacearum]
MPLDKWLFAMYLVVTSRKGISSIQLAKEIGITQKTAWFMLQRIREACGNNNDDDDYFSGFLSGVVEADETYIGGKEKNKHSNKKLKPGKNGMGKNIVFGMRQRNGKTRAIVICDMKSQTLKSYLNTNIDDSSILCTDKNRSYIGNKFTHRVVNHSVKQFFNGMAHTNSIESVWALLKQGFYGVYHQFSKKHLQCYINEFTYRLNEAHKEVHTLDGIDRLINRSFEKILTYCVLVSN